jgi:CheY-like chemotaxis protein/nitrogen-specific signal transduction histidine kinase
MATLRQAGGLMSPTGAAQSILVVEDHEITRKMLRFVLENDGYVAMEAIDGRSALAAAGQSMPDLVLQDLVLPDISGFELVGRLRALPGAASVPILALSGFVSRREEARIAHVGFNAMLVKPIEPSRLTEFIRSYLPRGLTVIPAAEGRHVLVVADDAVQRNLMRIHLRGLGFQVTVASSVGEALQAARKRVPDAILSDVLMPEVDGFQLCFDVRRSAKLTRTPVVLVSAHYGAGAEVDLSRRAGANALVLRTPDLEAIAPALLEAIAAGPPALPDDAAQPLDGQPPARVRRPSDAIKLEHAKVVVRQLERQVSVGSGLARRCTLQAAQLSLLGGTADALAPNADFDVALRDVLAATFAAAAISKGALFLEDPLTHALALRHGIGFSQAQHAVLATFFGQMPVLQQIVEQRILVSIPSAAFPEHTARIVLSLGDLVSVDIVPLISQGHGIGAILLGSAHADMTSEDAVAFARAIGSQIVQALDLEVCFRRLSQSEQRYRTLMENANDGISILTPDGVVREANHRLEEILGVPKDQIVGHRADLATPTDGNHAAPIEIRKPDGSTALLELSHTPVKVGGEQLIFSIARDVTERVRSQFQLMVSDRMASVGMLAAGVAHEINNPLAAVTGNLEIVADDLAKLGQRLGADALARLEGSVRDAQEAAERVRAIVKDLGIFSRAEDERLAPVDVHRVLDSSLRMAWNEIRHRARLVKDYGGQLPHVSANQSRLGQVFLNLIVNAAQAIPEGHADTNEVRVRTRSGPAGTVVVEIADTGPGVPPKILKQLFTPFFTTKPQGLGTGLGLVICQRIVADFGGQIGVTSQVGAGTVFRVVLPATDLVEETPVFSEAAAAAKRRGLVLVVDDEKIVTTMVRRVLADEHDVQTANSAAEALHRLLCGERFDVVLCDIMMPVMTGVEFHAEVARLAPDQSERIVFMTGGAFTAGARAFLDHVPNACIEKPFEMDTLRALVNATMRRAAAVVV